MFTPPATSTKRHSGGLGISDNTSDIDLWQQDVAVSTDVIKLRCLYVNEKKLTVELLRTSTEIEEATRSSRL